MKLMKWLFKLLIDYEYLPVIFGLDLFPEPQWLAGFQGKEAEIRKVNTISQHD